MIIITKPTKKQAILMTGGLLCSCAIAAGVIFYIHEKTSVLGVPTEVAARVDFPLFYPRSLPKGMTVDEKSFTVTSDVLIYAVNVGKSQRLVVSIMPGRTKPDVSQFNPTRVFETSVGKVYIASLDDRTSAAILGKESWALINVPGGIDNSRLDDFINSLR